MSFLALVLLACLSYDGVMGSSSCVMNEGRELGALGSDDIKSALDGNVTTGGSAVDTTIFWGLVVVVVAPPFFCSKSCVLCVLVSLFFTLDCPWVLGIVLFFCATHLS